MHFGEHLTIDGYGGKKEKIVKNDGCLHFSTRSVKTKKKWWLTPFTLMEIIIRYKD